MLPARSPIKCPDAIITVIITPLRRDFFGAFLGAGVLDIRRTGANRGRHRKVDGELNIPKTIGATVGPPQQAQGDTSPRALNSEPGH